MSKKSKYKKSPYYGLRVATKKGETGVVIADSLFPKLRIVLDGCETVLLIHKDELYFPNHSEGYNQKVFTLCSKN
jgi:hypothetical protein